MKERIMFLNSTSKKDKLIQSPKTLEPMKINVEENEKLRMPDSLLKEINFGKKKEPAV